MSRYIGIKEVKEILGMEEDHFDQALLLHTAIASEWADSQLSSYDVKIESKRVVALLYCAYLARTAVFESHSESESSIAIEFKKQAESIVKILKYTHGGLVKVINKNKEDDLND